MKTVVNINILTMIKNLPEELLEYFNQESITLLKRENIESFDEIDYVLVSNFEEAFEIDIELTTSKKEIEIICFSDLIVGDDFRQFVAGKGRFVVSAKLAEFEQGRVILDNYFFKRNSAHLTQAFECFSEKVKQFSITNYLNSGSHFDQTCFDAEAAGFNTLPMRTFLDHSLFYLTYLKQSGTGSVPFEFEYSSYENLFAVSVNMNVRDFFAEYLMDSFGDFNRQNPSQYLMKILSQTCDYLDICYLEKSSKIVLKAFWNKDPSEVGFSGIALHQIETASQAVREIEREVAEFIIEKPDLSGKKLPGDLFESVHQLDESSVLNNQFDEVLEHIISAFNETNSNHEIANLSMSEMLELLPVGLEEKLSVKDKSILLDAVHKTTFKNILDDQIEVMKEQFSNDEVFQEEISLVAAKAAAEEVVRKVEGSKLSEFLEKTIVKGTKEESDNETITIGGESGLENDEVIRIKGGTQAADNFKQIIKGVEKEEKDIFVKAFSNTVEKEPAFIIAGSKADRSRDMDKLVVKSLQSSDSMKKLDPSLSAFLRTTAPQKLEQGLERFAEKLGKDIKELTNDEVSRFSKEELPLIIGTLTSDTSSIEQFALKIKGDDKEKVSPFDFNKMSIKDAKASAFSNSLQDNIVMKVKRLGASLSEQEMQDSLKETVTTQILEIISDPHLTKEEKEKDKTTLIGEVATTLGLPVSDVEKLISSTQKASHEEVKSLVQDKMSLEASSQKPVGNSLAVMKLKKLEQENERLQKSVESFKIKAYAREKAQDKVADINQMIGDKEVDVNIDEEVESLSSHEKEQLVQKLMKGEPLSEGEARKIEHVFGQEETARKEDLKSRKNIRKLELDAGQKEIVFSQEIERFEKELQVKEVAVEKSKQCMRSGLARKEEEVTALKNQVNTLSQKLQSDESTQLKSQMKVLVNEKEAYKRSGDIYKAKLEALARTANAGGPEDSPELIAEENRMLKRTKAALEKQAQTAIASNRKLETRFQKLAANEMKFKVDTQKAQDELKAAQLQIKNLKEKSRIMMGNAQKKVSDKSDQTKKDLDLQKSMNLRLTESLKKTETKLTEVEAQLKLVPNKKELEDSIAAKYTKGLRKASVEIESMRSQNSQLQEKLQSLISKNNMHNNSDEVVEKPIVSQSQQRLERSVTKLNSDLIKAQSGSNEFKKDALKAKKEVMGLKNQLMELQKELEKAKKQAAVVKDKKSKVA